MLQVPSRLRPRHAATSTHAIPTSGANERQARCVHDLQPCVGTMTLAYRKEPMNEDDPLSRRPDFVFQVTVPLFWDDGVPSEQRILRRKSLSLSNSMIVNASRLNLDFRDLIREGYSQDSFYWDEGEWTKELTPRTGIVGAAIACLSKEALRSD
jgi:hypothetical protein